MSLEEVQQSLKDFCDWKIKDDQDLYKILGRLDDKKLSPDFLTGLVDRNGDTLLHWIINDYSDGYNDLVVPIWGSVVSSLGTKHVRFLAAKLNKDQISPLVCSIELGCTELFNSLIAQFLNDEPLTDSENQFLSGVSGSILKELDNPENEEGGKYKSLFIAKIVQDASRAGAWVEGLEAPASAAEDTPFLYGDGSDPED